MNIKEMLTNYESETIKIKDADTLVSDLKNWFKNIETIKQEFVLLYTLNTKNQIISRNILFIGTLNESLIHPREIFKRAIMDSSNAFILIHNHPSGDYEPSKEDNYFTKTIEKASKFMKIQILDHIIISKNGYYSYKEEGKLNESRKNTNETRK